MIQTAKQKLITNRQRKTKTADILSKKESLRDKLDVVTSSEPARECTESILVLDKNKRDIKHVKESQLNESTKVILVEPTGDNSESVLVLDTDYGIEESVDNSELDENNDGANTQNIITAEQSKPNKTAVGDIINETKTNIVENNSESEKTIIQDKVTNEIQPGTTNTDIHTFKDKKDNLQKTNKTDTKPSDKPPKTEDIPKKIVPKTIPDTAKKQNVSTRLDTNSHKDTEAKYSEENEVARSNLANSKFVQILQSRMLLMLGEKCTVTEVIRFDGRFSKIYRCIDSRKQDFAIKVLKKQSNGYNLGFQKKNMMMELQNGVPANNLNCVRLITGFVASGLWCYFMEYYPMNLEQAFFENKRSFHIDHVQILSRQLVSAVTILRNNNIIHSDIKPSHILINSSQTRIKLCGFDQASYLEESSLLPNTGTVNYRAPELILGYPAGYGIDVWSTALVMYEMATNNKLFPGFYNNNILYQQLCTLGAIPMEMLMESQFRNAHFRGTAFMKRLGSREKVIINEIEFNGKLNTSLFQAYSNDWGKEKDIESKREDKKKLRAFLDLLSSMLAMHPRCRIAIEFVFANPFIYESFDDC
ncbi:serine/threonine-protein kinase prp4-like [Leguminivora glycinivorella]|uniref:serine/threonine-protein kinase prp4-like n=1 Tax=Leguminivora glycinivorella TaxID=1035111 RepID=UPI00200C03D2|nr:serine/threonine-protein kinase prp4-like [Leguminivora glycinivorella]